MKKILVFITLSILFSSTLYGNDIRSKVQGSRINGISTNTIDPNNHVYGISWGTTEDEFVNSWGEPAGYVRFDRENTGMLYGKRHMFLFTENKLSGLKITHSIFDWQLSKKMLPNHIFDAIQWKLNNGIKEETDLATVKKKLGSSFKNSRYEKFYETSKSKVLLSFSHYTDSGDADTAYRVHSVFIELKK